MKTIAQIACIRALATRGDRVDDAEIIALCDMAEAWRRAGKGASDVEIIRRFQAWAITLTAAEARLFWDDVNWLRNAALTTALAAAPVAAKGEWQPIETAPKDGARIILSWSGKVLQGFYLDNSKSLAPWKGFRPMSGELTPPGTPDHWQPLPTPPTGDAAKEEKA